MKTQTVSRCQEVVASCCKLKRNVVALACATIEYSPYYIPSEWSHFPVNQGPSHQKTVMPPLQPFGGPCRKLILAFDVGTTFSGVAYSLLDPGEVPKIQGVTRYIPYFVLCPVFPFIMCTRFPGQENAAGDSKIPSILYYSSDGTVRAVGAEAALPSMALEAEDEDLIFVEWCVVSLFLTLYCLRNDSRCLARFKLHLRPDHLDSEEVNKSNIPQLPAGKTVIEVFGDFLAYLFSCAHRYITETHANGDLLWHSVANHIEIVLSHPNGWEGIQQTRMRRAAILGGLVPDTSAGYSRIHFVTEGEASLHFCLRNGLVSDSIKVNLIIICPSVLTFLPSGRRECSHCRCRWRYH